MTMGLVSDQERRVAISPWPARTIEELSACGPYDGVLASVGYEPRSFAIAERLGPISSKGIAVEFPEQRTASYLQSLANFKARGFTVNQSWDEAFTPFVAEWLGELAERPRGSRVAIDVSSMDRKRIATIVEGLAGLIPAVGLHADLLYAPALLSAGRATEWRDHARPGVDLLRR
jgi:hypothetical protein